jgi:pyruvate dehydrogenase E2 component (dihydrolipoamide acetyltransferase)
VKAFVRQMASGAPVSVPEVSTLALPDFSQWGRVERQALSGIRRKTAEAMGLAWRLIPQVTHFDVADVTELEAARRRYEARRGDEAQGKVTVTVLAMKACAVALKAFPQFNASLDPARQEIILKRYYNIGVAVDTEHGLLVPVVRDADKKSIPELAAELHDLSTRARERKIELSELKGASFTITNLGGIGGTSFTPIINAPEVAILGVARSSLRPVYQDGKFVPRLILPFTLAYDHRVIDGAAAVRFTTFLAQKLSDVKGLLEAVP